MADLKPDFACDGSLRDIYVLNTNGLDWDRLGSALEASGFTLTYSANGRSAPFPASLTKESFDPHRRSLLVVNLTDDLSIDCHFFALDEIEFSFDPRLVHRQEELDRLLDFIVCVGRGTGKPVLLTLENSPDLPILTYEPNSEYWAYRPPGAV
ncbi:MAG TPA: hypothetical protein VKS60_13530 [Stellaceae bacterium]|nr:hypothetical protein [Stellaceae bacterium]